MSEARDCDCDCTRQAERRRDHQVQKELQLNFVRFFTTSSSLANY